MILLCEQANQITYSDLISIAELLITSILGVILVIIVQRRMTNNRALKEYFIDEYRQIIESYNTFLDHTYEGNSSSTRTKEWFKIMTIRIQIIEECVDKEFEVKLNLLEVSNKLKVYITSTEEFNSGYQDQKLLFKASTKNKIIGKHTDIRKAITCTIIQLNVANKKRSFFFKTKSCKN
jgi:hypothetical protein